tara:strand:+ start:352 stop:525 length:174 start_codon:yes stop_codon:yes gene_type:complete
MSTKPYVITMTEIHAMEFRVRAESEASALDWLEEDDKPIARKKLLDRTIEVREERNS